MNRMMSGLNRLVRGIACVGIALVVAMTMASSAQAQTSAVPPGAGTAVSPYLISQLEHLVWMGDNVGSSTGKYYTLQNNIDASDTTNWNSGAGFAPIGTDVTPFGGVFNGNGKVISNLSINRPGQQYVGLFGFVGSSGVVKDLGLAGGSVTGYCYVGGLVGVNAGTVSGCYATGSVTGAYGAVGGLVGYNNDTVSNCYATGSVTGTWDVGGLVGYNSGPVSNCYATGSVTGGWDVGGFVAINTSTVSNSYWDTQTSGQATSDGGTGKTTAQMKQQVTFVGWDFANVWRITENVTYPLFVTPPTNLQVHLTIIRSAANVILTWPTNATGFTLQSTTNLVSPAVWNTVSPAPVIVNGQNAVTNQISGKQKFFRLSQ